MSLILKYNLSRIGPDGPDEQTLRDCDDGFEGMRQTILVTARILYGPLGKALMWLLTRVYVRRIEPGAISYVLPLIRSPKNETRS